MLKKIILKNFKSHKNTPIEFGNLTILCGSNGVGKSSIIQILLLLRDVFLKDKSFEILNLKSDAVKIGTVNDAVYEESNIDGFECSLSFSSGFDTNFFYEAKTEDEKTKSFIKLNPEKSNANPVINFSQLHEVESQFSKFSLFNTHFQYISAARSGPLDIYEKDDIIVDIRKQISEKEGKAEYFVHFLDKYQTQEVIKELCKRDSKNNDLLSQVVLWEKYIFNGANTVIENNGKLGYSLKYSFDKEYSHVGKTLNFDAKNVGFGLSYTLPILVAILSAKPDSLIIIENPEAHLHPNGISRLCELICIAAQAGIQIIIETHSDHIINGVLVQSKKNEENGSGINRNNIKIYQFDRDISEHCTISTEIKVEEDGVIRFAPKGFFDQIRIDSRYLIS
ncbi:Predicted ATPase [Flexibacter flexilis DSM 6793]|uniref:Predicted ATPase n=1 Tax=Flexibacter flexilis DSM 6793 TaxID=927664 RepID=A0A1I1H8Q6_9BACT|nr:DUF3696 domain-containing protein [Flexibacter flexilis]SFC20085.1 Predicted ATPase [Flexibacter flexilis DSM 6793]